MKLSENLVHPTNDELKELQKFDYKEVMKGISIEKEHTKDERVAARIALDHLKENPHYYRDLAKAQIEDVMSYDFFAILEADDDDVDPEDIPLGMSKEAYLQKIGKTPKAPEVPKVPKAKPATAAPAKQEEPFHWEGHKAHEWEKAARAKGMPSLRRPKPEEIKHPWDAVDPRSEADYTSLLKRQMRMDKNTAAVKEREAAIGERKAWMAAKKRMLIPGHSHMTRSGNLETRPSRVRRKNASGAMPDVERDVHTVAALRTGNFAHLTGYQTDQLQRTIGLKLPPKSAETKAKNLAAWRARAFKGQSKTTLELQRRAAAGAPLSADDVPKKKEPAEGTPPKQKITTVTKRHGAVTHTFENVIGNRMNNNKLREEVNKTLTEFFGSNFKPVGSFKTASQGSPNRYSWSATPKNGKLGSKKAIAPDTSFKKEGPGFVEKVKGFFRERARSKERKALDNFRVVASKRQAASDNQAEFKKAFNNIDFMAPSKTKVQGNFDRPSIEDKPGFSAKPTPKTITPREKGEVNPAVARQERVDRASKAALALGKQRDTLAATPVSMTDRGVKAPEPPKPMKMLGPASKLTIKRGEAEAKREMPSSGQVIAAGPASMSARGVKAPEPPKPEATKVTVPGSSAEKLTLGKVKQDLNLNTRVPKSEAPKARSQRVASLRDTRSRISALKAHGSTKRASFKDLNLPSPDAGLHTAGSSEGPDVVGHLKKKLPFQTPPWDTEPPAKPASKPRKKKEAGEPKAEPKKAKGKKKVVEAFGSDVDEVDIPTYARNKAADANTAYDTDTKDAQAAADRKEQAYRKLRDADPKDKAAKDSARSEFNKARDAEVDARKWAEKSKASKDSADSTIKDAKKQLGAKAAEDRATQKASDKAVAASARAEKQAEREAAGAKRLELAKTRHNLNLQRIEQNRSKLKRTAAKEGLKTLASTATGIIRGMAKVASGVKGVTPKVRV